jgi:uncharacterized membrane protein YhaH (DUF805 family)
VSSVPKLLFSYEGQIGIKQFWLGLLSVLASTIALATVVGLVLGVGLALSGASQEAQEYAVIGGTFLVVGYAICTQLAVTVKRCKDRGRSGWCALLTLIPFVGLVWLVVDLGLQRGASDKAAV